MHFVQPPDDDQHKVVFNIAVTSRHYTAQDILNLPRDRELTIIGSIPLKSETLWLYQYYGFRHSDRVLIRDYVAGLEMRDKPGAVPRVRSAYLHWFDSTGPTAAALN